MDLSALAEPKLGRAVSGLTEANVALTRCGLVSPSDHLRRSFVPAFPRGTPPRISFDASPLANLFYPTLCLEQSAVAQHGMHDDREAAGKGDTGLLEASALSDLHGPCLQGAMKRAASIASQSQACEILMTIPGAGVQTSAAFAAAI